MMRPALAALALLLAACGELVPAERSDEPALYKYASIQSAMAEARSTLDVFWAHHDDRSPGEDGFRLKVAEPSDAYERDYVWVEYLQPAGEELWRGAVYLQGGHEQFRTGDTIEFSEADIVDWAYIDGERLRGAYTSRAMLDLAPNANVDNLSAIYHEEPTP
ncbi:MAG: DUF2314 domain-containing protein [Pseudomonadota bacterium]